MIIRNTYIRLLKTVSVTLMLFFINFNVVADDITVDGVHDALVSFHDDLKSKIDGMNMGQFRKEYNPVQSALYPYNGNYSGMSNKDIDKYLKSVEKLINSQKDVVVPDVNEINAERRNFILSTTPRLGALSSSDKARLNGAFGRFSNLIAGLYQYEALRNSLDTYYKYLLAYKSEKQFINNERFDLDAFLSQNNPGGEVCDLKPAKVESEDLNYSFDNPGIPLLPEKIKGVTYLNFSSAKTSVSGSEEVVPYITWLSKFKIDANAASQLYSDNVPENSCQLEVSRKGSQDIIYQKTNNRYFPSNLVIDYPITYKSFACGEVDVPCVSTTKCCVCTKSYRKHLLTGNAKVHNIISLSKDESGVFANVTTKIQTPSGLVGKTVNQSKTYLDISKYVNKLNQITEDLIGSKTKLNKIALYGAKDPNYAWMLVSYSLPQKRVSTGCFLAEEIKSKL